MSSRFLIEVPHEAATPEYARAVEVFLRTGSHVLTHADWGGEDGDHRAWTLGEVESKDAARSILPPLLRPQAKIVPLNQFRPEETESIPQRHGGREPDEGPSRCDFAAAPWHHPAANPIWNPKELERGPEWTSAHSP